MTIPCAQALDAIDAGARLPEAARAALDAHLADCPACRSVAETEARIASAWPAGAALAPSPRLTAALTAVPAADRRRRTWAVVPLAWGSLAAAAVIGLATWLARAPAQTALAPAAPTPGIAATAPAQGRTARDADDGRADHAASATAGGAAAARRATPTPTGPLAAVAALVRPLLASPTADARLALAPRPRGGRDGGDHRSRGPAAPTAADLTTLGGDASRRPGPAPSVDPGGAKIAERTPGPSAPPATPDATPGAPTTPEGGRSATPGPTDDPSQPPGIVPGATPTPSPPPTGTPSQDLPPPIGTPRPGPPEVPTQDPGPPPAPGATDTPPPPPTATPSATATATATPTATATATATPTTRPSPTP